MASAGPLQRWLVITLRGLPYGSSAGQPRGGFPQRRRARTSACSHWGAAQAPCSDGLVEQVPPVLMGIAELIKVEMLVGGGSHWLVLREPEPARWALAGMA